MSTTLFGTCESEFSFHNQSLWSYNLVTLMLYLLWCYSNEAKIEHMVFFVVVVVTFSYFVINTTNACTMEIWTSMNEWMNGEATQNRASKIYWHTHFSMAILFTIIKCINKLKAMSFIYNQIEESAIRSIVHYNL